MSLTLSGTNGVVGAGFTIDPSGINVAVGVVTATSINANASGLTGELPAGIDIPAAQIVGVCTAGLTRTGGFGRFDSYAIICDQKSNTTDAGTFTTGDWRTRDLNTELYDPDSIVSISSNQFTLAAGSYLIEWSCPVFRVGRHQSRLYDITGSASIQHGISNVSDVGGDGDGNNSNGAARVTISANNVYEIQHQCSTTYSTTGLGHAADFGTEIYTLVKIFKEF